VLALRREASSAVAEDHRLQLVFIGLVKTLIAALELNLKGIGETSDVDSDVAAANALPLRQETGGII
jgi:hypothetical protein